LPIPEKSSSDINWQPIESLSLIRTPVELRRSGLSKSQFTRCLNIGRTSVRRILTSEKA
jgi:orotate phosphoribosyltransferase-like protein